MKNKTKLNVANGVALGCAGIIGLSCLTKLKTYFGEKKAKKLEAQRKREEEERLWWSDFYQECDEHIREKNYELMKASASKIDSES